MSKKITNKRLENIALYYLERYSSSSANLRKVLQRRIKKDGMKGAEIPSEAAEWVEEIVAKMVRLGYINDEQYKDSLVKKLKSQGKSARQIKGTLLERGVSGEVEVSEDEEYEQALIFMRKKKLGFYHGDTQTENTKKDLQKMALAGFSYSVIRKVLCLNSEDEIYD